MSSRHDGVRKVLWHRCRSSKRDVVAQVSFSVIATVLLLSTVATGAYVAKRHMDGVAAERAQRLVRARAYGV